MKTKYELSIQKNGVDSKTIAKMHDQITNLQHESSLLTEESEYVTAVLNDNNDNIVNTYDSDKNSFTTGLQLLVYKLLECHIAPKNVVPVIEACFIYLGKSANRLPSRTTINTMNMQRLQVCQVRTFFVACTLWCILRRLQVKPLVSWKRRNLKIQFLVSHIL